MDATALSLKMNRLVQWLDSRSPPESFVRKRFDGPPYGNCYVTIDRGRQAPAASPNMNRVYLCGTEAGMDSDSIRRLIELFTAERIERFFVWLSPGPDMATVSETLYMLEHSYRNLQRAGFEEAYEKEVYGWNA
jgi:hypothetical protein